MENTIKNQSKSNTRGWLVTIAGTSALLAMGALYAWSVFKSNIPADWGWSDTQKSLPYSVAVVFFSIMTLVGARLLARLGPRLIVSLGGVFAGLGMILSSISSTPWVFTLAFGVLLGSGIGFVYSSAGPSALRWFPASKTGLISGLVVGGFGMGSVWVAPLAKSLIANYGLQSSMLFLGIGMMIVVVLVAQFVRFPPAGYIPAGTISVKTSETNKEEYTSKEMLKTWQFYAIWFAFALGSGAGLMVIGNLSSIIKEQIGLPAISAIAVSALAIGNGGGRVLYGLLSDKFGRKTMLIIAYVMQALLVTAFSFINQNSVFATVPVMIIMVILIGANYGANLSVYPSITKDYYGLKNFAINYGFVYLSWGLGGFMLSQLAGIIKDATGSFFYAYLFSAALLIIAIILVVLLKRPQSNQTFAPTTNVPILNEDK